MFDLVVCDVFDVIETFLSKIEFNKVDLPTFVLPIIEIYPHLFIKTLFYLAYPFQ